MLRWTDCSSALIQVSQATSDAASYNRGPHASDVGQNDARGMHTKFIPELKHAHAWMP